ncbi:4Fe-4S dicluster domain-containing protein [Chloroflexota bacterium]
MSELKGVNSDSLKVHSLSTEGKISRRELLKLASPFGKVELDGSKCTGCGLCALDCPTGALTVSSSDETDAYQLLFKHSLCIACAECVEVCPEQCLHLERTLESDRISAPATVLFEDEITGCPECGSPVGSRAMINNIRDKVLVTGQFSPFQFELCPTCKIKTQLNYSNNPGVHKTY